MRHVGTAVVCTQLAFPLFWIELRLANIKNRNRWMIDTRALERDSALRMGAIDICCVWHALEKMPCCVHLFPSH